MTGTQDANLPVGHGEMAGMLGMAKETLSYYCRIGKIPRPHRLGNCYYYTAHEARQISEWWEARKRLVFKHEGEPTNEVAPLTPPESRRASRGGPDWLKASTRKAFSMLRYRLHEYSSVPKDNKPGPAKETAGQGVLL